MSHRARKSSACVTLVLIGAAALSGCGDQSATRRANYPSKEECLADWGDPRECEQQETRSNSGVRPGYFWGPSYRSPSRSSGNSSRSASTSSGSHSISRGGFGSHGSSAS
jgi:uncharacterized protein YgiB involved in biofilm formation